MYKGHRMRKFIFNLIYCTNGYEIKEQRLWVTFNPQNVRDEISEALWDSISYEGDWVESHDGYLNYDGGYYSIGYIQEVSEDDYLVLKKYLIDGF